MGVYIAVCVKRAQALFVAECPRRFVALLLHKEVITAFFGVSVCSFCVP